MKRLSILFLLFLFSSCATIKTAAYKMEHFSEDRTVRIVQISDFHSNDFGKNESRLIKKVKAASPDLIFLTGDIFEYNISKDRTVKNVRLLLEGIKDIAPIFYVTGNHEYFYDHNDDFAYVIEEYGGKVLKDKTELCQLNQGIVEITGIFDPFADMTLHERLIERDNKEKYLERLAMVSSEAVAIKDENSENPDFLFSVLLAHRPEYIKDYLKYEYDLILSGHAHGGQWKLPFVKNGLYAPMQGIFPKYSGGRYNFKKQGSVFIVSRGLSHQVPNIPRFFNPPELVVIEIR